MTSRTEVYRKIGLVACLALFLAFAPASAMTVDEVIARHVEASGGKRAWEKIESMKISGSFTAFSKITPFTLQRKRDSSYHLDSVMNELPLIIGYDGRTAWWENGFFGPGAKPIQGIDLVALSRDFDFTTPLFDYKEKGYTVELIGETEYEGYEAIGIELTRTDETKETWYLDPQTYLALARASPGSDFGRPMPQRTFFDDYREIAGVKLPYLTESQWYTRDRVMVVENVEINVPIDDELFLMPAALGMGPFRSLPGTWKVVMSQRQGPDAEFSESERPSTIEAELGGALLRERFETQSGISYIRTISFDRFNERYRITQIDSNNNQMDIREGTLGEDGRLVASNLETGTSRQVGGGLTLNLRTSIFDFQPDSFEMEIEVSTDGGENWWVAAKATYERQEETEDSGS